MRATVHQTGRHCADTEILEPSAGCPLCRFSGERRPLIAIQHSPDVLLLECPRCKGASASRMPRPATLAAYYDSYYSHAAEKVTFDNPARFARHVFGFLGRAPRPEFQILDFGGGDGALSIALAELLVRAGARRVNIDLIDREEPAPAGPPHTISVRHAHTLAEITGTGYDLVLASAILEHLPDPRPDLLRLFEALGPAGLLYARTPWMAPIFRVCARLGLSFDFTYPAHVHDLGRAFWKNLAGYLPLDSSRYRLRRSTPSIVETAFAEAPLRTLAAYAMKTPWRVFPGWPFTGGWEVVFERL